MQQTYFVGRNAELDRFNAFLRDPVGQAALVIGQAGMGKTELITRSARNAEIHPDLKCGWVRHEVTPTDNVDGTMALMIDHAFEAAQVVEGSFAGTPRRRKQWEALIKTVIPKGDKLVELVASLRRDVQRKTRDQFVERLELISRLMPDSARAIFIVDPEKYMQSGSDQSWTIVVRRLPARIKLVFAQRPEDQLAGSAEFCALPNVVRIPDADLPSLDAEAVEELTRHRAAETNASPGELRTAMARYQGHPYALDGAFKLLAAGRRIAELPADPSPTGIATAQWRKVCESGAHAIRLFKAYAILEVAVPFEVVESVADADADTRLSLLADRYLNGLLREESDRRRIYHALLADHIRAQIGDDEAHQYHQCAADEYRRRLTADIKPDALAAVRLPEHVLALGEGKQFLDTLSNECGQPLVSLGLLGCFVALSRRALEHASSGSLDEATVLGNLAPVYQTLGDLPKAEQTIRESLAIQKGHGDAFGMAGNYGNLGILYHKRGELVKAQRAHRRALELSEELNWPEGMASALGNLGILSQHRGNLDEAEVMHRKALEMERKLGRLHGIASECRNLGVVYEKRGDLDAAERMLREALEGAEKLGNREGMANAYGNLGRVYRKRGDLKQAETLLREALGIEQALGRLDGVATAYSNLGLTYQILGDIGRAREMWTKGRDLYEQIGMAHMVEKAQGWLDKVEDGGGAESEGAST